jgi:parvulin-like peptidyl-prolyl isomerase
MKSVNVASAEKGGNIGYLTKDSLPGPLKDIIDNLKPGDISPVLEIESLFNVFFLQGMTEKEAMSFDAAKPSVVKAYISKQYKKIYAEYIEQLKADTEIIVDEDALKAFENNFK